MPPACPAQYIPVGAEIVGIGADDLEEMSDAEADDDYYKLGAEHEQFKDYASLALKPDHANRRAPQPPHATALLQWLACATAPPATLFQQ